MNTDTCEHCGASLSEAFGFGCCDACSERLHDEFEAIDNSAEAVAARRAMFKGFGWTR